jgi:3-hydroxyisobutyrate dehydrogenase
MGANMARRLKECGFPIAAVFDVNAAAAQALGQELGCPDASDLKLVTALSDVIITVVTDDRAMK